MDGVCVIFDILLCKDGEGFVLITRKEVHRPRDGMGIYKIHNLGGTSMKRSEREVTVNSTTRKSHLAERSS